MKRQDKYPDTDTFHYFNANPRNRKTCDCVIRAICTALGQTWEQTLSELTEFASARGFMPNDKKCYGKYLEDKGWVKLGQPRKVDGTKYTGAEFCKVMGKDATYIAHIGGHHIVAIVDGKVNDIWNCTGKCIGNYWAKVKEKESVAV